MKRVIKPFWSYNISKTEDWLSKMAKEGYILKDINTLTRVFTFEKSEPETMTYKICYENKGVDDISIALKREGWENTVNKNRWMFLSNKKESNEIALNPMRSKLLKRNRIIKNITQFMMILYGVIFLPIFLMLTAMGALLNESVFEVMDSDLIYENILFCIFSYRFETALFLVFLFGIYTLVKLNQVSKYIKNNDSINNVEVQEENILLIEDDKLIKKRKLNWYYYPEKTIKWLNNMESQGYNLCKVDKGGSKFYFKKDQIRKIKYVIDYQKEPDSSYYEIHKEDGWNLRFKTGEDTNQWCLWGKEYQSIEPEMYTEDEDKIGYAKNLLISHTIRFIPMILIDILLVYSNLAKDDKSYFVAIIFAYAGIRYSIFYINIFKSYLNANKKVEIN